MKEEGWVVCRVFKKRVAAIRKVNEHESPWYEEHVSFMPELESPKRLLLTQPDMQLHHNLYTCKQELEMHYHLAHDPFLQLPQLESPKLPNYINNGCVLQPSSSVPVTQDQTAHQLQIISLLGNNTNVIDQDLDQVTTDWRVFDKFVASQLSQEDDASKETPNYANVSTVFQVSAGKQETAVEYASTSTWK
ncbi:hypothetical protein J5N97_029899 [Dioscorea zingiberensis]|uniref:NAC domain-containing protein n=1 Tax=Dioscorea zingiberensis TaxID=325984 RepID=A0A9D5H3R0_9LILI|nr:hypothetical protein J5N97_029899 [Dioscorea zingiberensis]